MGGWWSRGVGFFTDNVYLYNGKELDEATGLYDYGARWYDPAVARFPSIDRFAEKFPEQSPYVYAANNSIKFIDVNGDSILIRIDNENVSYYDSGNLFNKDGSQYTGKGVRIKKDGSIKLKGFLKKTANALESIRTGGATGSNLVNHLESDTDKYIISKGKNSASGRVVHFDPGSTESGIDENGGKNRPSYIGLAHELAHALDWDDGTIDDRTWITYSDDRTSTNSEKFASHIENLIRSENNLPLRAYYGTDQGKPRGRLLIDGTRKSPYIKKNIGGVSIPFSY